MRATIINEGKEVKLINDKTYPISKYQKNHGLTDGTFVDIKIGTEYPEHCDENPLCEGDETCVICLLANEVARISVNN